MGYLNPILSYESDVSARCGRARAWTGLSSSICRPKSPICSCRTRTRTGSISSAWSRRRRTMTRLPLVLNGSSGFVYYVSITGITGTRTASGAELAANIPRIRRVTDLPVAIGFGVRTPAQAAEAVRAADAAVVASALIDTLAASLDEHGRARSEHGALRAGSGARARRGRAGSAHGSLTYRATQRQA